MIVLIVFYALFIPLMITLFVRLGKVTEYRRTLLDRVSDAADKDIVNREDWRWRFDELAEPSFTKMSYMFWKPLDSFYPRDPARPER